MSEFTLPPAWHNTQPPGFSLSSIMDNTLDVVARFFNARLSVISKIEGSMYTIMSVVDQQQRIRSGTLYRLQDTICLHMLASGRPLHINDLTLAPTPLRHALGALKIQAGSYLGVPLYLFDKRVFGALWVADPTPSSFNQRDIAMLELLARLLTYEIDRDAQLRHSERVKQMLTTQNDVDALTGLAGRTNFETTVAQLLAYSGNATPDTIAILTLRPQTVTPSYQAEHDDTLRQGLADLLMRTARIVDFCARIGTNEFVILLPGTSADEVMDWRCRMQTEIEAWNMIHAPNNLLLDVHIDLTDTYVSSYAKASASMLPEYSQNGVTGLKQP
jgi:GAF domain-containing protein